jgi:hypothetical protein
VLQRKYESRLASAKSSSAGERFGGASLAAPVSCRNRKSGDIIVASSAQSQHFLLHVLKLR